MHCAWLDLSLALGWGSDALPWNRVCSKATQRATTWDLQDWKRLGGWLGMGLGAQAWPHVNGLDGGWLACCQLPPP